MSRSLKDILNESNPSTVAQGMRAARVGTMLGGAPCTLSATVTSHILTLPSNQKAKAISAAFATAGTSAGAKTPVVGAPAAGEVRVSPNGNIEFNSTDAITAAEVVYTPIEGEIYTETISVASHVGTFAGSRKAHLLISVTASTGTSGGAKTIVARGSTPTAGNACLNNAGQAQFNSTDAITSATVTYVAVPGVGDTLASATVAFAVADKDY